MKFNVEVALLFPDHTWDSVVKDYQVGQGVLFPQIEAEGKVREIVQKENPGIPTLVINSALTRD